MLMSGSPSRSAAPSKLEQIWSLVVQHQGEIDLLRRENAERRKEVAALRECLVNAGLLCPTAFLRFVHLQSHMSNWRLDSTLHVMDVALAIGFHMGPASLRAVGASSKSLGGAVSSVLAAMKQLCPDFVYVCGGSPDGRKTLDMCERFSPTTGVWEALPHMTERRAYATAGIVFGKLYVCGGSTDGARVRTAERFDPYGNAWEPVPPMSVARECPSGGVAAGKFYVCGGLDDCGQALSSAERFDPQAHAWEVLPPMAERRAWPAADTVGGHLYVCGGRDGRWPLSSVERFDPSVGVWQAVPPMSEQRFGAAACAVTRRLFVCGGRSGVQALCSAERFDAEAQTWEVVSAMSAGRFGTAGGAAEGRLYIFGGYGSGQPLCSVETFDPSTGDWAPLAAMAQRREGSAAARYTLSSNRGVWPRWPWLRSRPGSVASSTSPHALPSRRAKRSPSGGDSRWPTLPGIQSSASSRGSPIGSSQGGRSPGSRLPSAMAWT